MKQNFMERIVFCPPLRSKTEIEQIAFHEISSNGTKTIRDTIPQFIFPGFVSRWCSSQAYYSYFEL